MTKRDGDVCKVHVFLPEPRFRPMTLPNTTPESTRTVSESAFVSSPALTEGAAAWWESSEH